jgi:uridylate kinase
VHEVFKAPGQFPLHRVLLKISGEILSGQKKVGIDDDLLVNVTGEIQRVKEKFPDIQIAMVVGGGNFFRGTSLKEGIVGRVTADYMGMLATVINAIAIQDAMERIGIECRVQTAFEIKAVGEPFIRRRAMRHLQKGRVVIFAGGTGNPYFSTDTAAVLRASEIEAEAVLKGTKVDGVYDRDPVKYKDAVRYEKLSFEEALEKKLGIMDATAFALCMDKRHPVIVYNALKEGNLRRVIEGEKVGTVVY